VRASLSLDGVWQARLDAESEFARELRVPLPWQAADPALREHTGVVWYRRSIEVPAEWRDHEVAVGFGAVDYRATVYADGREVGGHEGGYTPFEVVIPAETRELTLRVEDLEDSSEVPHGKQGGRWYTRVSGPWQSVSLLVRPRERVERVRVYPDVPRGGFRVAVTARVTTVRRVRVAVGGVTAEALVSPEVPEATVEVVVPDARLWSPNDPHLYDLVASLDSGDELRERVGLRSIEARDGQLFLNGQPFYMRGALDQAYWPETLYTLPSDEEIEREIRLAKQMGLNLLRKHIKPEDPRYLDACDRLGMLIWAEPANPTVFTETARAALRRDLLEMVERDFNRPSVVVWSLYNEDWGVPGLFRDRQQQEWVAELYRELKALDPTRPVCDNSGWAHVETDLNDYHEYYAAPERLARFAERLDYLVAHPEENFALGWRPRGGEPILISEWGNWGLSDPAKMRDRLGGGPADGRNVPPWFEYGGDAPVDRMKRVAGFEERFEALGLATQFGSPAGLCEFLQRRAFRALKAQLDEMRRRPAIQGHVVTELTDIEWEGNGWLDYWRQPKVFHDELKWINGPVGLVATTERHGYWCGEEVVVDLHLHNTRDEQIEGFVRWGLGPTRFRSELWATAVAPFGHVDLGPLRFSAPDVPSPERTVFRVAFREDRTSIELAFVPFESARIDGQRLGVVGLDRLFRQRLERFGFDARGAWREAPVVVAASLDEPVWAYLRGGGRVLYLAGAGGPPESAGLRLFQLPPGESWRMAAGAAWADLARLAPAPLERDLGYESAPFFPHQVIDAACFRDGDEVLAGWLEGWLANTGALALLRPEGEGRLLATTFRFEDAYGVDPVATLLLNRLVAILAEPD
jgi:hypothetical protein